MNTNTFQVTDGQGFEADQETAGQNEGSMVAQKIVFVLVWAAVSMPLIWGVLKAWDEAKNLF